MGKRPEQEREHVAFAIDRLRASGRLLEGVAARKLRSSHPEDDLHLRKPTG
jgi:hypothetical protein